MSGGLRERLGRLRKNGSAPSGLMQDCSVASSEQREPEAADWERLGFTFRSAPEGACLVRDVFFDPDHKHGAFAVSELQKVGGALSRLDPSGRAVRPESLLFLDTETTGLGQGAGNVPFLIGIGWWENGGFTVRQFVIRHPGEEAAMLSMLSEQLAEFAYLVTYNGRSFDWPLIKNRYILHRLPIPRDPGHFDFLYPSRSLWRTTLPSCRLGAVEEAKLGVRREDDVPGAMAPALYFQYLAERDASILQGVFEHNVTDIATLLALAIHFGRLLEGSVSYETLSAPELLRLGFWYERLGFEAEAICAVEEAAARPVEETLHVLGEAASFFKRRKRWAEAVRLWRLLAEKESSRLLPPLEPYVELAMVYEHRLKDTETALYWTEEAMKRVERRLSLSRTGTSADGDRRIREVQRELLKRKERLLRKRRLL